MRVPQVVCETGISADYWNEYCAKVIALETGMDYVAEYIRDYPVKKYEERYSQEKYENTITEKNKHNINRLNELSDIVNTFTNVSNFTEIQFKKVINEVYKLIYSGDVEFYKEASDKIGHN